MKDFVEFLIKKIVSKPEEVEVTENVNGHMVDVNIKVAQVDMGVVIGKQGKTIRSIRALAKAKAIKDRVKVYVHLEEDDMNMPNNLE